MKDLIRSAIYQGKNTFRDMSFTFWGLMYPIILAGFFYVAFSGITNMELETINIGIEETNPVAGILEEIDVVNIVILDKEQVSSSLESETIDGFIKEDLNIIVLKSGLNQTVIKGISDQIVQTMALGESARNIDFQVDYLESKTQQANGLLVIFYSLIAMVSTYGVFAGIETVVLSQANLSNLGARINTTPIKKSTLLISGMIVGLLINMGANVLLFLFLQYVLKLNLFTNFAYSILFIVLGNIFGISLGLFIGSSNKRSPGVKTMISIIVTLFLSFLSGLMNPGIKVLIEKNAPMLSRLNPIAIITNSLYKINLLENTKNLMPGMIVLLVYSIILMTISYLFLRRSQYDSI
ncbi:MAG: ABC transporter permease [Tissierellia bacterium]|jgi:ABC-2 type transport system permease protein|nr:ABC transporter permease [Tissierellia bacterium]